MASVSHTTLKTFACLVSTGLGGIAGFNYVSSGNVLHTSGQPGLDTTASISSAALNDTGVQTAPDGATTTVETDATETAQDSCCVTPASRAGVLSESGDTTDPAIPSDG